MHVKTLDTDFDFDFNVEEDTSKKKNKVGHPKGDSMAELFKLANSIENCPCIDMYALADEIYRLMKHDLRLERERLGRR